MTTPQDVAVTYTGSDDPFKDRIYRSGLTFTPGQTRLVPATLAERFLRHADVFKQGKAEQPKVPKKAADQDKADATDQDDTAQVLEQNQKDQDEQRQQEDTRFALMDQLDAMDKKALIDWASTNYKQTIHHKTAEPNVRDMVKGFVDQYGMP